MKIDRRALRTAVTVAGVFGVVAFLAMDLSPVRAIAAVLFVGFADYWVEKWDVEALSPKQMAGLSALILAFWGGLLYIAREERVGWFTWILLAVVISLPAAMLGWSLRQWRAARRLDRNGG